VHNFWRQNDQQPGGARRSGSVYLALGLLVLLAAVFRFHKLGGDLWFDEISDLVGNLRRPFPDILTRWPGIFPHTLFDVSAKLSIMLFGEKTWALRLPAAIAGVVGVPAIFYLSRLLTNTHEALLAALLLTMSYHHVFFSQDARGYTMQIFFTALSTAALLRASARNTRSDWINYAVTSILNLYTHIFSIFVCAGLSVSFLGRYVYQRYRTGPSSLGLSGFLWASALLASVTLLLYSPMLPGMLFAATVTARRPDYGGRISGELWGELLQGLQAGYGVIMLAGLAIVGLTGFLSMLRRNPFGTAALVLPVVLAMASVGLMNLGVHPRFFSFGLPTALIIAIRGIENLAESLARVLRIREVSKVSRWGSTIAALGIAIVSLVQLGAYYRVPKQDFSGALVFAERSRRPDEMLVSVGLAAEAYKEYYAPNMRAARTVQELETLRKEGHRVWLLYTLPFELRHHNPEMLVYIQQNFESVRRFPGTIGNGTLYLCRAEPLSPGKR
jgi:mannosyltransferase